MSKWDRKVPFSKNRGDMLNYPQAGYGDVIEWREAKEFLATFRYETYERGRSAATFWFRDINANVLYPMFMTDFDKVAHRMDRGIIKAYWIATKRGNNFGIKML